MRVHANRSDFMDYRDRIQKEVTFIFKSWTYSFVNLREPYARTCKMI